MTVEATLEPLPDTWVTVPERPAVTSGRRACLVHIYPSGPGLGACHTLEDDPVLLGREAECDVCLNDHSVSRRHARIQAGIDGHYVVDLDSTNGTFVNDRPASMYKLQDGDYLRVGNWIYRYLAGGNVEAEYHEEIYRLTIIDALTGTHNKRYLLEFLERELARSARYRRPLSLILFDLDLFKEVNDRYGHLAGDVTLRELAARVKDAVRKEELLARYGGEEFALVLPETNYDGAIEMAERLLSLVKDRPFHYEHHAFQVTISLGAVTIDGDDAPTPEGLIRLADNKLYQAKRAGRNRVIA